LRHRHDGQSTRRLRKAGGCGRPDTVRLRPGLSRETVKTCSTQPAFLGNLDATQLRRCRSVKIRAAQIKTAIRATQLATRVLQPGWTIRAVAGRMFSRSCCGIRCLVLSGTAALVAVHHCWLSEGTLLGTRSFRCAQSGIHRRTYQL